MRLIDADAIAVIDGKILFMGRNAGKMRAMTVDLVKQLVATAPTIDAVEVRHGKWVEQLDGTHYCSECGHDATYTYDGTEICGIGCPFCYAKMDGKGEGE